MRYRSALCGLLAMMLVACGVGAEEATPAWTRAPTLRERPSGIGVAPEEDTPTLTPTPTPAIRTATPLPTLAFTLLPTATPIPIATPLPTPSPIPTAMPTATLLFTSP